MNTKRTVAAGAAVALWLAATGCVSQEQYDASLRTSTALQKDKEQLEAVVRDKEQQLTAERERSAGFERRIAALEAQIQQAADTEKQLRKSLDAARTAMENAMAQMEVDTANLRRTLEAQEQARLRWEEELAERNREIDRLKSMIQVIREELAKARREAGATTRP